MCVIMIKRILYLILLCLTAPVVQAQQHSFFTHYSTEDGLSQNTVMSMLQDHKDNLWFATWDGINRFDGYNFKTYKARQGNYISLTTVSTVLTRKRRRSNRFRQQVKKVVHITFTLFRYCPMVRSGC